MIIKSINISARKSKNYQTFEYGEQIDIQKGDDLEFIRKEAQARCRKAVMEQLELG